MFKRTRIKLIQLGLGVLCLVLVLLSMINPKSPLSTTLQPLDGFIYDRIINLSMYKKNQAVRIIVIDIDDYSIQIDGRWPWPRDKFATLINNLKKAGVVVAAFDIVLSEPEINYAVGLKNKIIQLLPTETAETKKFIPILNDLAPKVDNDTALANALKNSDYVLGFLFHQNENIKKGNIPKPVLNQNADRRHLNLVEFTGYNGILPLFLKESPRAGYVSNIPDDDGVVRHGLLIGNYQNKTYGSLALATVMRYVMADEVSLVNQLGRGSGLGTGLDVGGIFIPMNARGQMLIPYFGLPGTFDVYSVSDILHNKIPEEELAGSIAIVGSSMILLSDLHESPVGQNFPGVEMVANMVSGILSQQVPIEYRWNTWVGISLMSLIGLFYAILLPFLGPVALLLVYSLSVIGILISSFILFAYKSIYVSTIMILFLITLQTSINFTYNFILERRQKNKINQLFGQYLPPSHIKELLEAPQSYGMEGETREMSVFFSDIRNFTTISEALEAKEIKRLLNTFFTPVTKIIFTHKGTIDKYVGDMVVAFWGAPMKDPDHAHHAIAAALDIKDHLIEINETLLSMELPALKIGMGLSSGMMDVGDMGSTFRRSYTVLGDPVNLASRLQDLTKLYRVPILVSDLTRENQDDFFWCPVDKVAVKGRQKVLMIYTPLGYYEEASDDMKKELQAYEVALSSYYQRDWQAAITQFTKLIGDFPANFLYRLYLARSLEFLKTPPPENWDGAFIYAHK